MKSQLLTFAFVLVSSLSIGQILSGDAKDEGRELTSGTPYVMEGTSDGFIVYELTIDRTGVVTGARIEETQTTIRSTPTRMRARNHVMEMTFTPGTYYPEFQTIYVRITAVKPAN